MDTDKEDTVEKMMRDWSDIKNPSKKQLAKAKKRMDKENRKMAAYERKLLGWGWPSALIKATEDPFDYALLLKSGQSLYFSEATVINREWVHLEFNSTRPDPVAQHKGWKDIRGHLPCFERGVDVRVSEIVWVADAPFGS